jgi:hypothetical protein
MLQTGGLVGDLSVRELSTAVYTRRYELLRAVRNRRVLILSLAFPVILYLTIVAPNRHVSNFSGTGISMPLYFMVGLATFATMKRASALWFDRDRAPERPGQ